MRKEDIPFYNDPEDFENGVAVKYPCDTQYMVYNPMLHRYMLTPAGLTYYHIDAERKYMSDSPDKINELIEKTSKKVYDTIAYKVGLRLYPIMMYRIATAPKTLYADQYYIRKQFEQALADQARFLCEEMDTARFSGVNFENGKQQQPKPEDQMRDLSDISPECLRTLESMGLLRWFNCGRVMPDTNKY